MVKKAVNGYHDHQNNKQPSKEITYYPNIKVYALVFDHTLYRVNDIQYPQMMIVSIRVCAYHLEYQEGMKNNSLFLILLMRMTIKLFKEFQ